MLDEDPLVLNNATARIRGITSLTLEVKYGIQIRNYTFEAGENETT